tara:strand:+ start:1169 stop:1555 length:387 start_codon:yes stop_codon:yes gene_type:complete
MANGTIAFDTLTTSDQVNTNSEKSIDTSYIYNGVAKSWITFTSAASFTNRDSFNVSTLTDAGAGSATITMTNVMSNIYHSVQATSNDDNCHAGSGSHTTANYQNFSKNSSHSLTDATSQYGSVHGDLA